ncbi:MAG: hypothetical protein HYR64_03560 [Fimbriimonas ginsengisoli]|uniref:Uncharacterized protein n=1 Tax=Fimbriimonas ginsengisoli TaxID=1005039 RepID=A0A931PVD8_FIMGI|nr:hypothetical protein [Fimbriimonas ginsengisoli]
MLVVLALIALNPIECALLSKWDASTVTGAMAVWAQKYRCAFGKWPPSSEELRRQLLPGGRYAMDDTLRVYRATCEFIPVPGADKIIIRVHFGGLLTDDSGPFGPGSCEDLDLFILDGASLEDRRTERQLLFVARQLAERYRQKLGRWATTSKELLDAFTNEEKVVHYAESTISTQITPLNFIILEHNVEPSAAQFPERCEYSVRLKSGDKALECVFRGESQSQSQAKRG